MPPKKKQHVSTTEISSPTAATPGDSAAEKTQDEAVQVPELESELWTDEEEISLFKGMIRWKPVGMHKRFRMISLSQHMRNHGHNSDHVRPPGIRQKLHGLYGMKILDERENAIEDDDAEGSAKRYCEFTLPASDFYHLMMARRIDPDRQSSPEWLNDPEDAEMDSAVDDSEEPQSSRASSVRAGRGAKKARGIRGGRGGRRRGRSDSTPRGRSKPDSEASDEEEEEDEEDEEEDEDDDENENEEDDDNEDDEDENEDGEEEQPATTRGGRGRGRARGGRSRASRGGRGGRRRG